MTADPLDLTLSIHGLGAAAQWYRDRAQLMLHPPGSERGHSIRQWPLGERGGGELLVVPGSNDVVIVTFPVEGEGEDASARAAFEVPRQAEAVDEVTVRLAVGATTATSRSSEVDGVEWNVVRVAGVEPARWLRLADGALLVATDDEERLAVLAFASEVPVPTLRPVRLRSAHGWQAVANLALGASGTGPADAPAGIGVSLMRARPQDSMPWHEPDSVEHAPAVDGDGHANVVDGELDGLDALAVTASFDLPDAAETADELDVQLRWPVPELRIVLDEERSAALVALGRGDVTRWVRLDDSLLAGLAHGDELVALVATRVERQDLDSDMFPFGMLPDGEQPTQEQVLEHVQSSMRQQHERDHARLERLLAQPPEAVLGPVDPPTGVPLGIRLEPGLTLTWGDPFARMLPGGDRSLPLVEVSRRLTASMPMPPGADAIEFDDDLNWLHSEQAIRRQWAAEDDPGETPGLADAMAMGGPDWYRREAHAIADRATDAFLVVEGTAVPARRFDVDGAFVVRAEQGGWTISVRASGIGIGTEVPELTAVDDLAPFVAGQVTADERMLAWHAEQAAQVALMEQPPEGAEAMRRAVDRLAGRLCFNQPFSARGEVDVATVFSADVLGSWGGAEVLRPRFLATAHVADLQLTFSSCDRDGSVAHACLHVSLPRPDGGGFGVAVGIASDWWEERADRIREQAARQLPAEHQGEHHLQFNVLVERVGDEDYRVATDVVRLIDEHVGGIERLLGRP